MIAGAFVMWFTVDRFHWPFIAALAAGVGAGAVLGIVTDRIYMAPVRRASLMTQVMVLLALANILDGGFILVFGPETRFVQPYAPTIGVVPGLGWSVMDMVIMATTTVVVAALAGFLYFTNWGMQMRAAADNPVGASLIGVNPNSVALSAWALGGAITALGGVLIIPKLSLDPSVGSTLTFLAFGAVVLGGFGSLLGAVVGGILIGVAQLVVAAMFSAGYEPLVSLLVMLGVLTLRPNGLLGGRT